MPKLKTHKALPKRFKKTASGKVKRGHSAAAPYPSSKAKKPQTEVGEVHAGERWRSAESKADDSLPVEFSFRWPAVGES